MISSPGEVYAGRSLDYTTDTLPIELTWFDEEHRVFLSESSQFYLELRLLLNNVDRVFSIYNSFRKERADFTHLTEFQHIEFEGHVSFEQNMDIAQDLLAELASNLVEHESEALATFISEEDISSLSSSFVRDSIPRITFRQALDILFEDTQDGRYRDFTLRNFGAWEEIRLTQICNSHLWVTHFPMLETPFYHQVASHKDGPIPLAVNADLILKGSREAVGSGVRMKDIDGLREKARIFNLPADDYRPYFETRELSQYRQSAGFGLGWQRFVQWLIKAPAIWEATHVPRGHLTPRP
jgi:aspartyl/asparaginyl-tRNA synthetase